ncbi:MAG: YkgJ family cysteine cluster protein [Alphaproteobacteria bacterium]|nr:YkgJ family cysteine cluster protein [Alphaproteobacteria bacterium]
MAESGDSTATLRLTMGSLRIAHAVTVPNRAVEAAEIVPTLQGLVNAVVAAAAAGATVSCRKGCGACCRQLVPVSRTEGERLLHVIDALPSERRAALGARFAAAEARIAAAGLTDRAGRADRALSTAYFALGLPCPFLEEESCSIHPERPLVCREYLVTSPADLCAGPAQEGVTPVAVPKVSLAARTLQDDSDDWFPLALLLAWAREGARQRPREGKRRTGPEWVQRFLSRLAGK